MPNISLRKSRPGHTFGAPSISVSGCGNHKPRRKFNAEHKNVTPQPSVIESEPMFELNAAAEAGSRSINVLVTLPNADASLKGGMFVNGVLATASGTQVDVIPLTALLD